jgi:hypothetical protein
LGSGLISAALKLTDVKNILYIAAISGLAMLLLFNVNKN